MKDVRTLLRVFRQIYCILNKKQRMQMVGMFIVILVGSWFELLSVTAMLPFIQAILKPQDLMAKPYISGLCRLFGITDSYDVIIMVGIGIVLIYLIKNIYLAFSNYLQAVYNNRTQKDLSVSMLKSYIDRPYSFFVSHGTGEVMRGINGDVNGVFNLISNAFKLLSEILVIISIAIYLVMTDWVLAFGVLVVGLTCMLLVVLGLKKRISQMSVLSRSANARQYKWTVQIFGGIKDILVYCRQKFFADEYEKAYEDSCRANIYYTFAMGLPERIIEAFCITGIIITVLIRLKLGIDVEDFVPKMGVFAMAAFRLLPSISRMTGYVSNFVYFRPHVESTYENITSARKYREELSLVSKTLRDSDTDYSKVNDFNKELCINNVQWQYPEGEKRVLDGLSLKIRKGEAVGIIGESGSGKSTFADIILRLYHPQSGEILMDEINIDAIPNVWSKVIGYVPQSVFLVDDTIRENVIFGAENPDDNRVWEALRKASLDEFVRGLPRGLDTLVGERGVKFSGGQRQRIAIARALYANPEIMILDEATSALDNETEEAVMEAIDSLAGTMTLIIIAHRVTTLKGCDKIYEIVDGKAVERNKSEIIG